MHRTDQGSGEEVRDLQLREMAAFQPDQAFAARRFHSLEPLLRHLAGNDEIVAALQHDERDLEPGHALKKIHIVSLPPKLTAREIGASQ